jgi:hypothetical protein
MAIIAATTTMLTMKLILQAQTTSVTTTITTTIARFPFLKTPLTIAQFVSFLVLPKHTVCTLLRFIVFQQSCPIHWSLQMTLTCHLISLFGQGLVVHQ